MYVYTVICYKLQSFYATSYYEKKNCVVTITRISDENRLKIEIVKSNYD